MVKRIFNNLFSAHIRHISEQLTRKIQEESDIQKMLAGSILSKMNSSKKEEFISNIQLAEFKVFSQWGDDGIIDFLVDYLEINNKTFIEFGVENYREANTRFLLLQRNWKGLIFDGSEKNIEYVKNDEIYWKYDLTAHSAFITKDNINQLISEKEFGGEIGLLHIDIDGNDYWVWDAINTIDPIIVIVEYNSVFGPNNAWTIPYHEDFSRAKYHYSNLYFGTSLLSLCDLAAKKNYIFIGCNSNGNNAYFIKKEKKKDFISLNAEDGYITSKFRECRDDKGNLTYPDNNQRINKLLGLPIYNTRMKLIETIV
jgi:hypothetical protein